MSLGFSVQTTFQVSPVHMAHVRCFADRILGKFWEARWTWLLAGKDKVLRELAVPVLRKCAGSFELSFVERTNYPFLLTSMGGQKVCFERVTNPAEDKVETLQKYRKCWETHGEQICDHFQQKLKSTMRYTKNYQQLEDLEKMHVIMVMDQSDLMSDFFADAKQAASGFLARTAKTARDSCIPHAASIILFASNARTVVKQQSVQAGSTECWIGLFFFRLCLNWHVGLCVP